jgi:hypothetical protein
MKLHGERRAISMRSCTLRDGSGVRINTEDGERALLPPWREKGGKPEPKYFSGRPHHTQPFRGAKSSPSPVCAHAELIAALAGHPPWPIPLDADALDLEDRADHLGKVFSAFSIYVAAILDDTAQNVPGTLDLPHVEAILFDLAADVTGAIQHAAEDMGWRIA